MRRRSRIWRVAKWAGITVCVLILCAFAVSLFWSAGYIRNGWVVGTGPGVVTLGRVSFWFDRSSVASFSTNVNEGIQCWLPRIDRIPVTGSGYIVTLPLWIPLLLAATATVVFSRLERRVVPPGHCQRCGYNLTGNVSGVCPECGTKV